MAREVHDILNVPTPGLSARILLLIEDLVDDRARLDKRIAGFDKEILSIARADEAMRRLPKVPGIGPIDATALVAAIGDASAFSKGRDLSAWLGLVPRQLTTGGKPRLPGITKRANRYLRKNPVHK